MRLRGINLQQVLLGLALVAALLWNLAQASEINGLRLATGATGTRAEIRMDAQAEFKVLRLSDPERLVVDLPGSRIVRDLAVPPGSGIVKAVRSGQPVPGTAGPVVALQPRYENGPEGVRLVLEWPGDGSPDPASPAPAASTTASAAAQSSGDDPIGRVIASLQDGSTQQTASAPASQPAVSPPAQPTAAPASQGQAPSDAAQVKTTVATGVPAGSAVAGNTPAPVSPATAPPATAKTSEPPVSQRPAAGTRPLVIAIDAGHGGQDPGAIGPGGTYEKHVVLNIARELARQINATPGMQAYLVRDRDVYVELPQRARRARQARADMFVSIHADAAQNRNAQGSSVYTLSTRGASSQQARWLADRENASDLVGGVRLEKDTLSNVLLDLAQSGHMKASQDAARHVLDGLRSLGKTHKPQVEYANFSVLRNADMPAMLVETGFISNNEEEKRLLDPAHQRRVASAVLKGINEFFLTQPPPGTLYAARAAARPETVAGSR
jgi:N-acetylmuramoyl-L-alanine amidase